MGAKAGPDFTNLGVVDPATGKPVYLSAGEISTVLGATGGVAPTKFQAATEGFFKGVGQGQQIGSNVLTAMQQAENIDATQAQTEAAEIQNEIARQTKDATIQAKNNQVKQQAIQAQIQTDKLTADNKVLNAVRSGDPAQLAEVIQNPQTMLSAIEQDQYVQAAYSKIKGSNGFTPQQLTAFDKFNTTRDIFKQGPLQDQYQTAAGGVAGTLPFQQLQAASGMDTNDLLGQMKVKQTTINGWPATALTAPNGAQVILDPTDKTHSDAFSGFFSSRDKLQNAGRYKLPLTGQQTGAPTATEQNAAAAPAQADAPPAAALPAIGGNDITSKLDPGSPNPVTAAAGPGGAPSPAAVNPAATPTPVNPNGVSPLGVPLQTEISQISNYNKKATPTGVPLQAAITKRAQQIFAEVPPGSMTIPQAYAQASKEVLRKAPLSAKAAEATTTNTNIAQKKIEMAQEIRATIRDAEEAGLALGPNWGDSLSRAGANVDTLFDAERAEQVGNVKRQFDSLSGRHVLLTMEASGMGVKAFDSEKESARLVATGPSLTSTPKVMNEVADRYEAEARQVLDENTLAQFFDVQGIPLEQSKQMVGEYMAANKARIFDEASNSFILNKNRQDPLKWAYEKLGVDINQAASETFSTPTQLPKSPEPKQPPAAGSGTGTPFQPAQKNNTSAFPQPTPQPDARGAGYNATPASMKDIKAIAETAAQGGNIRQFQTGGSVPTKLDKATPDLVARVIGAESSGKPGAVSPTGVRGLMQVTTATFRDVGKRQDPDLATETTDRTDPLQSVSKGTQYLNRMLKQFDGNVDLALAAYNAGPGTVQNILDDQGLSTSRATIDMITPFLPTDQPTAKYVKKITSRGRVGANPENPDQWDSGVINAQDPSGTVQQDKGFNREPKGFFDDFSITDLNPFGASTVEAEEIDPAMTMDAEGNTTENPQGQGTQVTIDRVPEAKTQLPTGGSPADSAAESIPSVETVSPGPSTGSVPKVPQMDSSPRNDVPPVSEIQAALGKGSDFAIETSNMPATGKAVKFLRNSPVGKWLGEIKETEGFQAAQNFANAATFGLFDEGMGALESQMGFDGKLMTTEIRDTLRSFRKTNPKTAMATDILGSVAGGVGAGAMLRALKGGAAVVAASTEGGAIAPLTVKEGVKIGAGQGAARGFGEGETPGQRAVGATAGAVVGGATGVASSIIPKIPVVGGPAAVGAGVGALVAGVTEGTASGMAEGAGYGALAGGGAGIATRFSPVVQKAIASTVTKLNNYAGLQTLGNMAQKLLTGKTSAEAAADLNGSEAMIMQQLAHLPRGQLKSMLNELRNTDNPQIPVRLFDTMNDADTNTLIKVIGQLQGNKEVSAKVNQFLQARMSGQLNRMNEEVGPQELVEQSARRVLGLIEGTKKGATKEAIDVTEGLYKAAEEAVPVFDSPGLKTLMSTPAMKEAVSAARRDVEATIPKSSAQSANDSGIITDLSNRMFDRVKAGQPIDDLVQTAGKADVSKLPDNSFKILTEARRKLGQQLEDPAVSNSLKRDIGKLHRELTAEMEELNPEFATANAEYAAILSKVDVLKTPQMEALANLANGNVQQALPKIMKLPPGDLKALMDVVDDPKAFQDVARGFLRQKLDTARGQGDVASKLVSQGEWKNLEALLGVDEAAAMKATIDAESKIAKSGRSVTGGSDTVPKAQAAGKLDELTGKSTEPFSTIANVTAGSWKSVIAKSVQTVLRSFVKDGDPAVVAELADTLVLSAPKGMQAMEKILKARGLQAAEIRRIRPYLRRWQDTARGGGQGVVTSLEGQVEANSIKPRKKK